MRPARLLECLGDLLIAFYRWLQRLSINAHQAYVAFLRGRIQRDQRVAQKGKTGDANVELTATTSSQQQQHHQRQKQQQIDFAKQNNSKEFKDNKTASASLTVNSANHESGRVPSSALTSSSGTKTPRTRRSKLTSLFRRLSLRNFMEYCVIALNEASNSGCSNKFDLSSCQAPLWLLGKQYKLPEEGEDLIDDIRSKLWITYRRNFPPIDENTRYTTDRGFGCMIRCGQMVLANALLCKTLGRDWRWSARGLDKNPEVYVKILKLFQDREDRPYSIHQIVLTGQHEGKNIGEWFGPNTIAQALKRISIAQNEAGSLVDKELVISIDAALDNVVVVDEIKSRFKQRNQTIDGESRKSGSSLANSQTFKSNDNDNDATSGGDQLVVVHKGETNQSAWIPGILFIQLRLGLTKINPLYFAALKKTFQFKNSLGIIGGRPNHALYLIGFTEDDIIYLDPHSTQQYVDFGSNSPAQETPVQGMNQTEASQIGSPIDFTYHCSCPERMPIDRLDPSLALCFYFSAEEEFDDWCNKSQDLLIKSEQAPMFEITKSRPSDWNISLTSTTVTTNCVDKNNSDYSLDDMGESVVADGNKSVENQSNGSDHDEEFEMLA